MTHAVAPKFRFYAANVGVFGDLDRSACKFGHGWFDRLKEFISSSLSPNTNSGHWFYAAIANYSLKFHAIAPFSVSIIPCRVAA